MEQRKRVLTFLTFFICTACLAFLTASLATHKWIVAKPVRIALINTSLTINETIGDPDDNSGKFRGEIYFGLFYGTKVLNYGFGNRITGISMKQELSKNDNFMVFGLWLFTVLCVAIAMLFGIVSSVFAIINTVMTPIEVITGIQGLFLWNGLAALFCMFGGISWLFQYKNSLRRNVLTQDEQSDGWTSDGRSWFGYSYFFVIIALVLFLLNIILVYLAIKPSKIRETRTATDKNPEGVIMLY
ncbi:clarin-3-like [Oppia nitens]|uniref:clarin-3-like n=1 Tax=Oppia nitens TaxID=1686743 RepID=UPI0023DB4DD4|nr:clarin-3-like [Oppia nitens]